MVAFVNACCAGAAGALNAVNRQRRALAPLSASEGRATQPQPQRWCSAFTRTATTHGRFRRHPGGASVRGRYSSAAAARRAAVRTALPRMAQQEPNAEGDAGGDNSEEKGPPVEGASGVPQTHAPGENLSQASARDEGQPPAFSEPFGTAVAAAAADEAAVNDALAAKNEPAADYATGGGKTTAADAGAPLERERFTQQESQQQQQQQVEEGATTEGGFRRGEGSSPRRGRRGAGRGRGWRGGRGGGGGGGGRHSAASQRTPLEDVPQNVMIKGKVRSIMPYGAFVDIGSVTDGLLHVSQMSLEYVSDIKELISEGEEIAVRVISVDAERMEFSLSMLSEDDEKSKRELISRRSASRDRGEGGPAGRGRSRERRGGYAPRGGDGDNPDNTERVSASRLRAQRADAAFMAANRSAASGDAASNATAGAATAASSEGDAAAASAAEAEQRTNRRQRKEELKEWAREYTDEQRFIAGKVVDVQEFGAFVDVGAPTDGLVHISEISTEHVAKVSDRVNVGDEVQVRVTQVDTRRARISLSMKPYTEAKGGASRSFSPRRKDASDEGGGRGGGVPSVEQPEFRTSFELAFDDVKDELYDAGLASYS